MLNELDEFKAYTTPVKYEVSRKGDTAFLGRFTFESLLNFEGLGRILTILARGYLFRSVEPNIDHARGHYVPGAASRTAKMPPLIRSGNSGQIFGNCTKHSRSWWMNTAQAGFTAMFAVWRNLCWIPRIR